MTPPLDLVLVVAVIQVWLVGVVVEVRKVVGLVVRLIVVRLVVGLVGVAAVEAEGAVSSN